MAESLDELTGVTNPLIPPPRNPTRAPQAIEDLLASGAKGWVDWVKQPGQQMRGVEPQKPGQWSEEDEFRKQHLAASQYEWGPATAFGEVFYPRPGGTGQLTSGGGSRITQVTGKNIPVNTTQKKPLPDNQNSKRGYNPEVENVDRTLKLSKFEPYDLDRPQGMLAARNSDGILLGTVTHVPHEQGYRVIAESGPRELWINAVVPSLEEAKQVIARRYGVKMTPVEHDPFVKGYHGTTREITELDPKFGGSRGGVPDDAGVIYFSPNEKLASMYGENVIEKQINLSNSAVFDVDKLVNDPAFQKEMRGALERTATRNDYLKQRAETPAGKQLIEDSWQKFLNKAKERRDNDHGHVRYDSNITGAIIQQAKERGLDVAVVRNMAEGHGHPSDQYIVLNPRALKARLTPVEHDPFEVKK